MFRFVSKKVLPVVSALSTSSLVGVIEYQMVSFAPQKVGSPGSTVALVTSAVSLKGSAVIAIALAKLSLLGGAASALPGRAKASRLRPTMRPMLTGQELRCARRGMIFFPCVFA